jgi:hypothetical protein
MQLEIAKVFPTPRFASFHPNGGSIVAGFAEKLSDMAITINDIVTDRTFPIRSYRECHYFATVNGILDMQKDRIGRLTEQLKQLQQEGANINGMVAPNQSVDLTGDTAWPSSTCELKTVNFEP